MAIKFQILFIAFCIHYVSATISNLQFDTTDSFRSVLLSWIDISAFRSCPGSYGLNCTRLSDNQETYNIEDFTAVYDSRLRRCVYEPCGFEASTSYNCSLTRNRPFGTTSSIEVNTSSTMPSEPQDLGVFNVTSNSVIIAWSPPAVTNGLSRYIIYMNNLQINSISSNNTRYQVSRLIPGRSYSFHVVGSNQRNVNSPPSNTVNIYVITVPQSVAPISYVNRSTDTLIVRWSLSSTSPSYAPTKYTITYQPLYTMNTRQEIAEVLSGTRSFTNREITLTNLGSSFSYLISIVATNTVGTSIKSTLRAPPFIPEPTSAMRNSRKQFIQFKFSGVRNCDIWKNRAAHIASELFERLGIICPDCSYTPWTPFLQHPSTACSIINQDEVIFTSEVTTCGKNFANCDLNTHMEFFHSLPSSYLIISNTTLLLDSNCPLYASSLQSTDCFSDALHSTGVLAGGVIGSLIAEALIIVGIILIIIVVKKRRKEMKYGTKKMTPHPMTRAHPGKETGKEKETTLQERKESQLHGATDSGYEFLPVFNKSKATGGDSDDSVEYDIPKNKLRNLPGASEKPQYEIPDINATESIDHDDKKTKKSSRKATYVNVRKKNAKPEGSSKVKSDRKKAKVDTLGQSGGGRVANVSKQRVEGQATKAPPTSNAPTSSNVPTAPKAPTASMPPPPPKAPPPPEEEEEFSFSSMRKQMATNLGGGAAATKKTSTISLTDEGGKKKPLIPQVSKASNGGGSGAVAGGKRGPKLVGSNTEYCEMNPLVKPKPKKGQVISTNKNVYFMQ